MHVEIIYNSCCEAANAEMLNHVDGKNDLVYWNVIMSYFLVFQFFPSYPIALMQSQVRGTVQAPPSYMQDCISL